MYEFLKNLHSGWAYLVLFFGITLVLLSAYFLINKKPLGKGLKKISFFTTLTFHIQFLIGVILYFVSPFGIKIIQNGGMKAATENDAIRLTTLEHPLMMFAAVLFITIANAKIKRSEIMKPASVIFIIIAMTCILAMIPWSSWMK